MAHSHVMIDLETLGTGSDAMILTIAAVEFDPNYAAAPNDIFYARIDIDSYKPYTGCFTMDGATLSWWMTKAPEGAKNEAFLYQRLPLKTAMENFVAWMKTRTGEVKPWSHGSSFDISIVTHTLKILGLDVPWKFWDIRDTRTIYEVAGVNLKNIPPISGYPLHHAVGDCLLQIEGVRQSYEILNDLKTKNTDSQTVQKPRLQKKHKQ